MASSDDDTFTFKDALDAGMRLQNEGDKKDGTKNQVDDEGREERFTSAIEFPNFLMQVLRIVVKKSSNENLPALDDKALIKAFEKHIGKDIEKVKGFVFTLLKIRYLFDRYIVKRERASGKENWSLKKYKFGKNGSSYVNAFGRDDDGDEAGDNWSCAMLLSAFHVSYPTNSRKNWLSAVLHWLNNNESPFTAKEYLKFIERLARSFMINRYITDETKEYLDFIYDLDKGNEFDVGFEISKKSLSYGSVRIFTFNYLDYLLWKDGGKKGFKFSSKNSVEHFSPQTPKANEQLKEALHSFGNLCLMASTDNSSLNNDSPEQKAKILELRRKNMAPFSLKLELMLAQAKAWGSKVTVATGVIEDHEEEMLKVLKKGINTHYDTCSSKDEA